MLFNKKDIVINMLSVIEPKDPMYDVVRKAIRKGFDLDKYRDYYAERDAALKAATLDRVEELLPKGLHYDAEYTIHNFIKAEYQGLIYLLAKGYLNENNELMYVPFALSLGKYAKEWAEEYESEILKIRWDMPERNVERIRQKREMTHDEMQKHLTEHGVDNYNYLFMGGNNDHSRTDTMLDNRSLYISYGMRFNAIAAQYMFTDNTKLAKEWFDIAVSRGVLTGRPEDDMVLRLLNEYISIANDTPGPFFTFLNDRQYVEGYTMLLPELMETIETTGTSAGYFWQQAIDMMEEAKKDYLETIYGITDDSDITYKRLTDKEKRKYNLEGERKPEQIQEMIYSHIFALVEAVYAAPKKRLHFKAFNEEYKELDNVPREHRNGFLADFEEECKEICSIGSELVSLERNARYNYVKTMEKWSPGIGGGVPEAGFAYITSAMSFSPALLPEEFLCYGK